jgi:carbamate kinase
VTQNPIEPLLAVVALGGNAMQRPGGDDSVEGDFDRTAETAGHLVAFAAAGRRLVVTHGNGPQVGNHLLRSELGMEQGGLPYLPLDVCVADTQGGMGYMLQQCLSNAFHDAGIPAVVASLVTQVIVDAEDPAFDEPSKPVGEMISADKVNEYQRLGWKLREDPARGGWRRVVASPDPTEIVEAYAIRTMVAEGVIVVAAGGGGVPVVQDERGRLAGAPAVVDKDLASALLATDLKADALLILTDVERVCLDFGGPNERPLDRISVAEVTELQQEGQFPAGSMGPKVEAVRRFVTATGGKGVITSIEKCEEALDGKTGTTITP